MIEENSINIENQCMQGIGYKEIYKYLIGEITMKEAIDLIKLNTRHYAKRQITFFKKLPGINYIRPDDCNIIAKKIVNEILG